MTSIESEFNKQFAGAEIKLPSEDLLRQGPGQLMKDGWVIWLLLHSDEKGEYLDYYSWHRFAGESHERIRPDASHESLPAILSGRKASADPDEDARLEAEYYANNQKVAAMLQEKGFGPTGQEPIAFLMNRELSLKPPAD